LAHTAQKPINWQNFITVVSVGILLGTELIAMAWAAGWALSGLFQLPPDISIAIEIIFVLIGCYAVFRFVRAALLVEPIRT
jgi:hypothetical protein